MFYLIFCYLPAVSFVFHDFSQNREFLSFVFFTSSKPTAAKTTLLVPTAAKTSLLVPTAVKAFLPVPKPPTPPCLSQRPQRPLYLFPRPQRPLYLPPLAAQPLPTCPHDSWDFLGAFLTFPQPLRYSLGFLNFTKIPRPSKASFVSPQLPWPFLNKYIVLLNKIAWK